MASGITLSFQSSLAAHQHVLWTDNSSMPSIQPYDQACVMGLAVSAFRQHLAPLRLGRFYPAMILSTELDLPGEMFRVITLGEHDFVADFNHPLAGKDVQFGKIDLPEAVSGSSTSSELARWAGIETPLPEAAVDFTDEDAFARDDTSSDAAFYVTPRKLMHVDGVGSSRIKAFYSQHILPDATVLDLMAAWRSHLPEQPMQVSGLGMNVEEMADNPQLNSYVCHDLNCDPHLPFDEKTFDVIVNTVSIEYLTQPLAILHEARRVLRPGGKLLITFSNRFFPPKATNLWKRLHPVERLGWVSQILRQAGFSEMQTLVERGLKRDPNDRYAQQLREMDPLFAVCAQRSPV